MFQHVLRRLTNGSGGIQRFRRHAPSLRSVTSAHAQTRKASNVKDAREPPFDTSVLELLVCPLSKKPLRYAVETNELINEELGIAYPIAHGIPNMIPQEARLIRKDAPAAPPQA